MREYIHDPPLQLEPRERRSARALEGWDQLQYVTDSYAAGTAASVVASVDVGGTLTQVASSYDHLTHATPGPNPPGHGGVAPARSRSLVRRGLRVARCRHGTLDGTRVSKTLRQRLQVVAGVLLLLLAAYLTIRGGDDGEPSGTPSSASSSSPSSEGETSSTAPGSTPSSGSTPDSGLRTVAASALPAEGRATLRLVAAGGPFPYDRDGVTFGNRERILPIRDRGYYAEYTVPTPGESDRGARRLVVGDDGDTYYTADHYASFRQVEVGS